MRVQAAFAVLSFAALTSAQAESGRVRIYRPDVGPAVPWAINENRTLLWNGIPYVPVGLHIGGSREAVAAARASGVQDLVISLPASGAGWTDVLEELRKTEARFLISINSLAPSSTGYVVEPQVYRVNGVLEPRDLEVSLPGCSEALVLTVLQRDASVQKTERVKFTDGKATIRLEPVGSHENVILLYPRLPVPSQPDYWDGFDHHRDTLLATLRKSPPGPGLRGIVNPVGALLAGGSAPESFVPDSESFRSEFRQALEARYRTVENVLRAWSLSAPGITEFDVVARLVPLWSGRRGVQQLWDPQTDRFYNCEGNRSLIWKDIEQTVAEAGARRIERFIQALRREVDVPLLQDWAGWHPSYEKAQPPFDGLGTTLSGTTGKVVAEEGGYAASSLLRWQKPGWLVATSVDASMSIAVDGAIDDLASLGSRAWFFRTNDKTLMQAIATEATVRARDDSYSQYTVTPIFFPENAMNPAMPQRLPAGRWWLPSPIGGNRVDLGSSFHSYRYVDGSVSTMAIWTTGPAGRVRLRSSEPDALSFQSVDGVDPKPRKYRGGIEVQVGELPLLITGSEEIPVPEPSYQATLDGFGSLVLWAESNSVDVTQEKYALSELTGASTKAPGAAFLEMRRLLWLLTERLSSYVWIEAETSRRASLADPADFSSCSAGAALSLRSQPGIQGGSPSAQYNVNLRSSKPHEVWVAARIPKAQSRGVGISLGGQRLQLDSEPIGAFGDGFAWYYAGTFTPQNRSFEVILGTNLPAGVDVAVDSILLYPGTIKPSGPYPPSFLPPAN